MHDPDEVDMVLSRPRVLIPHTQVTDFLHNWLLNDVKDMPDHRNDRRDSNATGNVDGNRTIVKFDIGAAMRPVDSD